MRHPARTSATIAALLAGLVIGGISWRNAGIHSVLIANLSYTNAEKTARELIAQRRPGWITEGLAMIAQAARTDTPLRSVEALRGLTVECLGGTDLKARTKLTSINSACLAFSPDGKRLAVGEHHGEPDYHVQVFDAASSRLVSDETIKGTDDPKQSGVSALVFSPDGRWLAAGLRDGGILVSDTARDHAAPRRLTGHGARVIGLAFAPRGETLVSGAGDGVVTLWDATEGWRETVSTRVADSLGDLALSPDGRFLAIGGYAWIQVLDLASFKERPSTPRVLFGRKDMHAVPCFSPDGRTLAAGDWKHSIQLIKAQGGTREGRLIDPDLGASHAETISRIEFSPDGALLISGSGDNSVKIWDVASHQLILTLPVLTESVVETRFSPDGRALAVGSSEGTTLYDVLGLETMTSRGFHPDPVSAFSFVPARESNQVEFAVLSKYDNETSGQHESSMEFWSAESIRPLGTTEFKIDARGALPAFCIASHPRNALVAHNDRKLIRLYRNGAPARVIAVRDDPASLCFSPDGEHLWGVVDELQVVSWSVFDLSLKTTWEDADRDRLPGRVGIPCLSAGSRWVVAGSRAGLIYVLRTSDGQREATLKAAGPIQCIALSPDESLVVCGLVDGRMELFRLPSGDRVGEVLAHQDTVNSLVFHPRGRVLTSASRDKTVALWNVDGSPSLSQLLRIPSPSGHPVLSAKFSPDGRILGMLVQNEHAVRLWHLDRLRLRLKQLGLDWEASETDQSLWDRGGRGRQSD
jgi:WD40 repeat protein